MLAQYHARREAADAGASDQFALAEWCEQHGLRDEAAAHYVVVTRLKPKFATAWTRLGYRKFEGSWRTKDQIVHVQNDRHAREQADARYRPWLTAWLDWLNAGGDIDKAIPNLATLSDPLAVSSIRQVFAPPKSRYQPLAVLMLSGIDANEATIELCKLAVDGSSSTTRRVAGNELGQRDPRVFVGYLINRIREPVHFEVRPGTDGASAGELWVEDRDVVHDYVYDLPEQATLPRPRIETASRLLSNGYYRSSIREIRPDLAALGRDADAGVQAVERKLAYDIRVKESEKFAIDRANERVLPLLQRVTGQQLGPSREKWTNWWIDQLGYSYQSSPTRDEPKPVVVTHVQAAPPPPVPVVIFTLGGATQSCFARGTTVQTETGGRPIESLSVGDLVLARDTRTGSLSYRPIVATFHNPPAATLRVDLGSESIVATPIHRFWKSGAGWTLARDLQPGDHLQLAHGEAAVASIQPAEVQNVFNLEVLDDHDFFVGSRQLLVHDNTLVRPNPPPD
jgi:hypothetical protein